MNVTTSTQDELDTRIALRPPFSPKTATLPNCRNRGLLPSEGWVPSARHEETVRQGDPCCSVVARSLRMLLRKLNLFSAAELKKVPKCDHSQ